jgi:hypothetical protein
MRAGLCEQSSVCAQGAPETNPIAFYQGGSLISVHRARQQAVGVKGVPQKGRAPEITNGGDHDPDNGTRRPRHREGTPPKREKFTNEAPFSSGSSDHGNEPKSRSST